MNTEFIRLTQIRRNKMISKYQEIKVKIARDKVAWSLLRKYEAAGNEVAAEALKNIMMRKAIAEIDVLTSL